MLCHHREGLDPRQKKLLYGASKTIFSLAANSSRCRVWTSISVVHSTWPVWMMGMRLVVYSCSILVVQSTGAHPQLGDVLEPLQDMPQHVAGAMQIAHLHGLHAHGGVRLQHLPPHPLHGRMQGLHRQVHALQGAGRQHKVRLHALGGMRCSRRAPPRAQPAEGSLVLWATLCADVIMLCDRSFEMLFSFRACVPA